MSQCYRILIVDDEPIIRRLMRETLASDTIEVLEAENGAEGLKMLRSGSVDLVVLDWLMPRMTGLEVLVEVRRDLGMRDIPVIMLTAKASAASKEAAQSCGANAFLTKPFSPLELMEVVEKMLTSRGLEGAKAQLADQ